MYSFSPGVVYISSTVKSYSIPNITNKVPFDFIENMINKMILFVANIT